MTTEQQYELQMTYQKLQEVEAQIEAHEESIEMEKHFALVENREPQLFALFMGWGALIDKRQALEAQL